jgi:hypothetical protein
LDFEREGQVRKMTALGAWAGDGHRQKLLTKLLTNYSQHPPPAHYRSLIKPALSVVNLWSLFLDTVEVTGSRPLAPTIGNLYAAGFRGSFFASWSVTLDR